MCVISNRHRGIIAIMNNEYLGWGPGQAHHRFCVRHLASNFHTRFHDKALKMLLVRAAYKRQPRKFEYRIGRLAQSSIEANAWLREISLEKWL